MTVCIIPVRDGSKRIPLKHSDEFSGKLIIAHSILLAFGEGLKP